MNPFANFESALIYLIGIAMTLACAGFGFIVLIMELYHLLHRVYHSLQREESKVDEDHVPNSS